MEIELKALMQIHECIETSSFMIFFSSVSDECGRAAETRDRVTSY